MDEHFKEKERQTVVVKVALGDIVFADRGHLRIVLECCEVKTTREVKMSMDEAMKEGTHGWC